MGLRIFNLVDKKYFDYNIDRTYFHTLDAIIKHSDVDEVVTSGRGWNNFNPNISVYLNMQKIYAGKYMPDLVLLFLKDFEYTGLRDLAIPKCIRCNEMYSYSYRNSIMSNKIDLVICHHRNDMIEYHNMMSESVFENIPHCVDTNVFKDYELSKSYDLLLVGNLTKKVYPFRCRLKRLINERFRSKYNCKILNHPGYRPKSVDTNKYKVLEDFSKEVNKAKITLTCSSVYKYALTKYFEVPLSNSLIAADIPSERRDFFSKYVLELCFTDSDDVIEQKLEYYLAHEDERNKLIDCGKDLCFKERSVDVYANKFVYVVTRFLKSKVRNMPRQFMSVEHKPNFKRVQSSVSKRYIKYKNISHVIQTLIDERGESENVKPGGVVLVKKYPYVRTLRSFIPV
jgi:hypothetical protein